MHTSFSASNDERQLLESVQRKSLFRVQNGQKARTDDSVNISFSQEVRDAIAKAEAERMTQGKNEAERGQKERDISEQMVGSLTQSLSAYFESQCQCRDWGSRVKCNCATGQDHGERQENVGVNQSRRRYRIESKDRVKSKGILGGPVDHLHVARRDASL